MTSAKTTVVIIDSNQIVDLFLAILLLNNSRGKVETLDGEVHHNVELVTTISGAAESFEVSYKNIWRLPKIKFLACSSMLFTARAVPHVLLGEDFGSLKLIQALLQADAAGTAMLPPSLYNLEGSVVKSIKR
ncbi:hypothetical protein HG530_003011 [Fusarium avenaceum]|nr:hypothetical protein HG530_003011 [Fusarium avenaceum]